MTVRPYEKAHRPVEPKEAPAKKAPAKKAPAKKAETTDNMSVTKPS
jgi:hypothetical protein